MAAAFRDHATSRGEAGGLGVLPSDTCTHRKRYCACIILM